ncbi:MAG: O-antigen ligase family protein [Alphaproteobacteria bacterium]|nr:O-antigen ligase family protein [Alphaproteobacteria bacterium]MCD8569957.1 O-antigen ligase family protein [Alphaproteobacteria bacterium]
MTLAAPAHTKIIAAGEQLKTPLWIMLMGFAPVIAALGPRALSFLPAIILVLGVSGFFLSTRKRPLLSVKPLIYMACVSVLCLISSLWSPYMPDALERGGKIALVLMGNGLLLAYILARPIERLRFFPSIFLASFIAALLLLASELYWEGPLTRAFLSLTGKPAEFKYSDLNRGIVAAVLCIPAALALAGFTITDSLKRRAVYGLIFALITTICLLTFSQSSHLALAVMGFFFFFFPYKREWAWLALAMTLSALMFATPFMVQFFFQALPPLIENVSWFQYSYALERLEIWDYVSRYAMQQPMTGYGVEATRYTVFDTAELYQPGNTVLHPHNFAVQIWMEFGVLGATLGSLFLLYLLDAMRTLPELPARVCLASLMGSLAVASTGYGIWQGWWLGTFILVAGYCLIVIKIYAARVTNSDSTAAL